MNFFKVFFIVVCAIIGGSAIYVWLGWYNVAATSSHWKPTAWVVQEVRDQSIAYYGQGIRGPSLLSPARISAGFEHFHETCRLCHGAPGFSPLEFAPTMNPKPPDLKWIKVQEKTDAELYWVVKNGVKMTGMPAFGSTHTEEQLWDIVAFLRQLPNLAPEDYGSMARTAKGMEEATPHGNSPPAK
jgi:mono/diheme cytochrome c family protein